jgi:hypothetical protein
VHRSGDDIEPDRALLLRRLCDASEPLRPSEGDREYPAEVEEDNLVLTVVVLVTALACDVIERGFEHRWPSSASVWFAWRRRAGRTWGVI